MPEPDASIRATALLYWQDPEELEMRTRELLRLKERLWQIPFYREALGVSSGAHFLMGWICRPRFGESTRGHLLRPRE